MVDHADEFDRLFDLCQSIDIFMASHCVRVLFGRPWDLGNYAEKLVPKMLDSKTATSMPTRVVGLRRTQSEEISPGIR